MSTRIRKRTARPQGTPLREGNVTLTMSIPVQITMLMVAGIPTQGVMYEYRPGRIWPWLVRPDGWRKDRPGIAFGINDIEPLESAQEGQYA